MCIES